MLSLEEVLELDCVSFLLGDGRLIVDISSALAKNGAIVYIVGRRKEKLDMAVKMHESVSLIYL